MDDSKNDQKQDQQEETKPEIVRIEGLVLLKIIKHCNEYLPQQQPVSGQLLGLQLDTTVEVTNCFGTPLNANASTIVKYQKEMLELLESVRADNNTVGWYRSALNGNFLTTPTIEGQFKHQNTQSSAVCIIYDPTATKNGRLVIRAFRLTDKFMAFYRAQKEIFAKTKFKPPPTHKKTKHSPKKEFVIGPEAMAKHDIRMTDIFEELDVKIHNSHLVHAFLYDAREETSLNGVCFDRLHHLHESALISNLRQLNNSIDQYSKEADQFRRYWSKSNANAKNRSAAQMKFEQLNRERRLRGEKAKPVPNFDKQFPNEEEPDRMESVTITAQMSEYVEEIEASTVSALTKLWITQGLHVKKLLSDQ